jgi:NDP-sugar pyrophosphorylase family protein
MAIVAGRPFLTHLLDQLIEFGLRKTVLCTGYMSDVIRNEMGNSYKSMELVYSKEASPLGTGGALREAVELMSGDMLLVLNGDSYCQCHMKDFIAMHSSSKAYSGMVLAQVDDVTRFGAVRINGKSLVESFIEKGGQTGPGWINAGIYLLPKNLILGIRPDHQVSLEKEVFPSLIQKGLFGFHCSGSFIDIGIPEEYQRSQLFFSEQSKGTQ